MADIEFEILLIEDNPDHAQLVKTAVHRARRGRYHVWLAKSAEAAIKLFETMRFNLIIADYRLPGKNGLELLDWLNEQKINTPMIMLTGQGDEKTAVEAMREGAYNYVVKDDVYLQVIPHVIDEALLKYLSNQEKMRLEREVREKNVQLEKANRELKKLDELKSDFIASVTHEIKTPLNAVRESMSLFIEGLVDPKEDKGKHILEIGQRNIDRLTVMINDLLDFSKLEAGKMRLHLESCDLRKLAEEVAVNFQGAAEHKKITLSSILPPDFSRVYGDSERLIQVLTNLVNNAIKFTPENGRITICGEVDGSFARVSVDDTGIGIAKENQGRIFERFEQVRTEIKMDHKGTGLGLSICKELIKLHHGKIWVESEPGKGSRFVFTVPMSEQIYKENAEASSSQKERDGE